MQVTLLTLWCVVSGSPVSHPTRRAIAKGGDPRAGQRRCIRHPRIKGDLRLLFVHPLMGTGKSLDHVFFLINLRWRDRLQYVQLQPFGLQPAAHTTNNCFELFHDVLRSLPWHRIHLDVKPANGSNFGGAKRKAGIQGDNAHVGRELPPKAVALNVLGSPGLHGLPNLVDFPKCVDRFRDLNSTAASSVSGAWISIDCDPEIHVAARYDRDARVGRFRSNRHIGRHAVVNEMPRPNARSTVTCTLEPIYLTTRGLSNHGSNDQIARQLDPRIDH